VVEFDISGVETSGFATRKSANLQDDLTETGYEDGRWT
jgi:hypothetical protein